MNKRYIVSAAFVLVASVAMLSSCRDKKSTGLEYARNMYDHLAYEQDAPNKNFANGQTAQNPVAHTVPVGFVKYPYANDEAGLAAAMALVNPVAPNEKNLAEGKHLFNVFCAPCHGEKGDGQGHIVKLDKGISGVPAYFGDATSSRKDAMPMKDLPAGRIYHTIMYGLNAMGSHASQLTPTERWKVVAYVQELQKSK